MDLASLVTYLSGKTWAGGTEPSYDTDQEILKSAPDTIYIYREVEPVLFLGGATVDRQTYTIVAYLADDATYNLLMSYLAALPSSETTAVVSLTAEYTGPYEGSQSYYIKLEVIN